MAIKNMKKIKKSKIKKTRKIKNTKKTKKDKIRQSLPLNINIESLVLLESRHIFLYEVINSVSSKKVCKELIALDELSHEPIVLVLNSPGGSVTDGFAIIDTMRTIKSPVVTLVTGAACSMAALISITGYQRVMSANAYWMGHEMVCGGVDYYEKNRARNKFYEVLWARLIEHLKKFTKLSLDDLERLRRGELWLSATEAKQKGVTDHIM